MLYNAQQMIARSRAIGPVPPLYYNFPAPATVFPGLQFIVEGDSNTQPANSTSTDLFTNTGLSTPAANTNLVKGWKGIGCNFTNGSAAGVTANFPSATFANFPGGRAYLSFSPQTGCVLQGSQSASFYNFLHQGPMTLYCVVEPTNTNAIGWFFDTGAAATGGPGIGIYSDTTSARAGTIACRVRGSGSTDGTQTLLISSPAAPTLGLVPNAVTVVCVTMDGSGNVVMYLNNAQHVTGTLSAKSTDNARYALCLGGDAASAGSFTGNMMLAAGCNQVHTEAQRIAAHKWISARWMTTTDVACLGDSITALDQSPASNQTGINTLDWPTRMQNLLGTSYRVTNFAVSGAQVKGAQNLHGIKLGQLESTNGPYRTHYKIYTFLGGNNDIGVAGLTAAQTWDLPLASSGTGTQAVFDEITNDPSSYLFAGVCLPNKGSSTYWGVSNPQGVWTPGANGTQGIMDAYASYIQGYVPPSGNNNYTWVDTFTPFTTPGDTYTMLANGSFDGLHPRSPFSDVIAGIFALAILQKGLG